jgi:nudix-type nucleoside diphosphatase (YffH/AdpP family)
MIWETSANSAIGKSMDDTAIIRVRNYRETISWKGWSTLKSIDLEYQRRDGAWEKQHREVYDRGHGAAVLLYHLERRTVILVRQFRIACHAAGHNGFLLEVPAGMLDTDDPEGCIRREIMEETGFQVTKVNKLFEAFSTPGSVTEKLHFFAAPFTDADRVSDGGGAQHEGEDIEVLEIPIDEAHAMIWTGQIEDAKTILLLQHAAFQIFKTDKIA